MLWIPDAMLVAGKQQVVHAVLSMDPECTLQINIPHGHDIVFYRGISQRSAVLLADS